MRNGFLLLSNKKDKSRDQQEAQKPKTEITVPAMSRQHKAIRSSTFGLLSTFGDSDLPPEGD
jgi:hypothetical protein